MSLRESTAAAPPLLGIAGWDRAAWCETYYPADLPDDWRFSYLANQVDCLMLPPGEWYLGMSSDASGRLDRALAEAPRTLSFLLVTAPDQPPSESALARFASLDAGLLVDEPLEVPDIWPQWGRTGPGCWVAEDHSEVRVWQVASVDLRAWRDEAATLGPGLRALVLAGRAATPERVTELRTLLQLMELA